MSYLLAASPMYCVDHILLKPKVVLLLVSGSLTAVQLSLLLLPTDLDQLLSHRSPITNSRETN